MEAKKIFENQTPELDFTKIVTSLSAKPESKTIGTQFFESDFTINPSSKVISPTVKPKSQPKPTPVSQSHSNTQSQSNTRSRSGPSRSHSQSSSQSSSQSQSCSQSSSQNSSQKKEKNHSSSGQGSGRRSHSGKASSFEKHGKGSDDPIKMANKFDGLEDGMDFS